MLFFCGPDTVRSQADSAGAAITIELGEVRITAREKDPATRVLDHREMDQFYRKDVAGALNLINGLNFVNIGSRNESMITVRGFDLRQVPVYLDGVPVYVPYDGYVDLGRYLVHDLAKISVSKGVSSVLFGPNTLGGAINLVTGKPVKKLEINGSTGVKTGRGGFNGWHSDLNLGGRMGRFYYQAGYSLLDHNAWYLSDKYESAYPDDNGIRENSDRKDLKLDIKAGFIPDNTNEYSLAYFNQQCSKGVPVYTGADPRQQIRYWRFPAMDNQGIKLITKTALGSTAYLKTRIFYDRYLSDLRSYDDSSYASQDRRSSFISIYSDESFGGSAEYNFYAGLKHNLKAVIHYKHDHHSEHNTHPVDETVRHFRDQYLTFGAEENFNFSRNLLLTAGLSYNIVNNTRADNYDALNDSVFPFPASGAASLNAQFGLDYRITEKQEIRISLAHKTRFATMKDRYSYRLGRSVPNPSLNTESGMHADVSYALSAGQYLQVTASLFCSRLDDVIQQVYGVDPQNSAVYQYRNTGRAVFYGMETEVNASPFPFLQAGVQYTFLERKNLSHPELLFTDVPSHRIFGFLKLNSKDRFYVQFSSDFNSERPSTNDGLYVAKAFLVSDLQASARLCRFLSVEGGIKNLFDASYNYCEGYPEEGRNYFLSLRYTL